MHVIGAIDEPHISDPHLMMNTCLWKKYHSINVQGVCDDKLRFINIVTKWPGSTHDSLILQNNALQNMFETGTIADSWFLGVIRCDHGYYM